MSIKAVIDTNVIVSAYWTKNPMSPTARIYRAILSGEITILVNSDILCEYREVLNRPRFGFNTDDIEASLAYFELFGENIEPVDCDEEFVDVDDKIFYCTALSAGTQLVTGNTKHYPQNSIVVTPSEFCQQLGL